MRRHHGIALSARGRHPARETAIAAAVLLALILPGAGVALDRLPVALPWASAAFTTHVPDPEPAAVPEPETTTGVPPVFGPPAPVPPGPVPSALVPPALVPPGPVPPALVPPGPVPPGPVPPGAATPGAVPTVAPPPPDAATLGSGTALPQRPAPAPVSPVVARVEREAAALEALAQRVVEEGDTRQQLATEAAAAEAEWSAASDRYHRARNRTAEWARSSYLTAVTTLRSEPGPLTALTDGQGLARGTILDADEAGRVGAEAEDSARELAAATQSYAISFRLAAEADTSVTRLDAELTGRTTALDRLRAIYRAQLAAARISTDAYNAALSRRYLSGIELTGSTASPLALSAVKFALGQLGRPYVWGAEGPDTYDCSGLVQTAYGSVGISLPRTARPQYLSTTSVPVAAMLPGDLLFFGPDPRNWDSIHHVGIYLGGGRMVHAPTTGDVVRVAPVWWAEFFGATRVVGALGGHGPAVPPVTTRPPKPTVPRTPPPSTPGRPNPAPTPTPTPSPAPAPGPTTGPPATPSPTPTTRPPGSPTPTGPPSPTPTPSCPAPTPSGTPTPAPTPTPSPSGPPDPACSPSPTPTVGPTPSP